MNMLENNIAKLNDIVFENRNKSYGAYAIRSAYDNTILKSLSITVLIFASISALAMVLNNTVDEDKKADIGTNIPTTTTICTFIVLPPEKIEASIPKQKVASAPIAHAVSTIIKDETIEKKKDVIQTTDATNGTEGKKTNPDELVGDGPEVKNPSTGKEPEGLTKSAAPVLMPDVMPKFNDMPGFLRKNLRYPAMALDGNVSGRVIVNFIIDEKGNIEKATLLKGIGYGCDEEALRVIKLMLKWEPGIFNGKPVKVSFNQAIVFRLQ